MESTLIIFSAVLIFLVIKKRVIDKSKKLDEAKKILITMILAFVLLGASIYLPIEDFIISPRFFYCLSNDKCITVQRHYDRNEQYIILGKYKSYKMPSDNYVRIPNSDRNFNVHVIFVNPKKVLIACDTTGVVKQSSTGLIELYYSNTALNDSLYTYFDGKYRKYIDGLEVIRISLEENYALDNKGNKL